MNKVKTLAISVCGVMAMVTTMVMPSPVLAASSEEASSTTTIKSSLTAVNSASSGQDLPSIASTVINTMLFIVGILAVAMIIFSGIRYITAHGDKGQVESAKNTLIYSVVGLVIAIIAYAIVNWVVGLFGKSAEATAIVTTLLEIA